MWKEGKILNVGNRMRCYNIIYIILPAYIIDLIYLCLRGGCSHREYVHQLHMSYIEDMKLYKVSGDMFFCHGVNNKCSDHRRWHFFCVILVRVPCGWAIRPSYTPNQCRFFCFFVTTLHNGRFQKFSWNSYIIQCGYK